MSVTKKLRLIFYVLALLELILLSAYEALGQAFLR
jgi:hypothetical protein